MVKILRPPEKKNNVMIIGNKNSNSTINSKIPAYFGYTEKKIFKK